jgi:hypothetical protein
VFNRLPTSTVFVEPKPPSPAMLVPPSPGTSAPERRTNGFGPSSNVRLAEAAVGSGLARAARRSQRGGDPERSHDKYPRVLHLHWKAPLLVKEPRAASVGTLCRRRAKSMTRRSLPVF